jgi:hypothetical protein
MLLKRVPGTINLLWGSPPHSDGRENAIQWPVLMGERYRTLGWDRKRLQMTTEELDTIRAWDKRCGNNEGTFFPVTLDRRRLLGYVDELRAELAALKCTLP